VQTLVDLSSWAGQAVKIRFRMASDTSVSSTGWYVDDVAIASAGAWTAIGTSAPGGTSLGWTVPGAAGTDYCLRLTGQAGGYSPSSATGGTFSVSTLGPIFANGFETGTTAAWSSTTP
jgi:hypothetical protein